MPLDLKEQSERSVLNLFFISFKFVARSNVTGPAPTAEYGRSRNAEGVRSSFAYAIEHFKSVAKEIMQDLEGWLGTTSEHHILISEQVNIIIEGLFLQQKQETEVTKIDDCSTSSVLAIRQHIRSAYKAAKKKEGMLQL